MRRWEAIRSGLKNVSEQQTVTALNQAHWNRVSAQYAKASRLFAPEELLLETFRDQLPTWTMLDVGIGAGRTTMHFAPVCRSYAGLDYAPTMVGQARRNCPDYAERLVVADACDLNGFASESFDFVLFSFNGLDCIAPTDRKRALGEIRRVLRPGGIFAFSSHNLDSVPMPGHWPMPPLTRTKPLQTAYRLLQRARRNQRIRPLVRQMNLTQAHERGWACFADGGESYEVPLVYVTMAFQRAQLKEAGFGLFSVQDRDCREVQDQLGSCDSWLYYLAKRTS